MPVLSATESISPAFRHTTQQMFTRFRFAFWLRMAVLAFFTVEMSGGGGFNPASIPTNIPKGQPGGPSGGPGHVPWHMGWFTPVHILELAVIGFAVIIVLSLIFLYINSVLRFVLFEAVLQGDTRLGDGWRKWRETGRKYFTWQVAVLLVSWAMIFFVVGLPVFLLWKAHHIGMWFCDATAIATFVLVGLVWLVLAMTVGIAAFLAKEFVVPIMALEHVGWEDGWRRFLDIARGHASEYVVYVLMKIVLRIGAGIVQGIVGFLLAMIFVLPAVFVAIFGVAIGVHATLAVKAMLITLAIVGGILLVLILMVISALVGAPVAFFFVSYSIYFFAGRYEPLGRIVFPAPPAPPIAPAPVVPEPPPIPA